MIVYIPNTEQGQKDLSKKVAESHAHAVFTLIDNMNISQKEKVSLLDQTVKDPIQHTN